MSLNTITEIYDFAANDVIIDGLPITGFGEDGTIEYEFPSNIFEHVSGADGHVAVSRQNDFRMTVTLTVMETSQGYLYLANLLQKQRRERQIAPLPMPYVHRDRLNNDLVKSPNCYFLTWPSPNKERDAGEREFQLLLPHAAASAQFAGSESFSL